MAAPEQRSDGSGFSDGPGPGRGSPGRGSPGGNGLGGDVLGGELPSWLSVVDAAISALETTAWDLRGVAWAAAAQATDLWDDLARDWRKVEGDARELRAELASWPGRLERLTDTGWMLARVAASYRLYPTRAAFLSERRAQAARETLHARNARRFADASARQGGGVLKVGQLLSTRPDLLPAAWIQELSRLQDAAPPVPFEAVRHRIEADLAAPARWSPPCATPTWR